MAIASHIFCFPKAGSGGGGGGGAYVSNGWIWQDGSQHEWLDDSSAIWQEPNPQWTFYAGLTHYWRDGEVAEWSDIEGDGGGGGVTVGTVLWEAGDEIWHEDGEDITWEN